MRIAVARNSTDIENAHFGYAEQFLVFDLDGLEPALVDVRAIGGHCTGTGGNRRLLRASVDAVADCVVVLALRIGPCARRALDDAGVLALEHAGPGLDGAGPLLAGLRRSRFVQSRIQTRTKERSR
jgi:nitrogen fixation protein NifB